MTVAHTARPRPLPPAPGVRRQHATGRGATLAQRSLAAGFTYIGVLVLIAIMGMTASLMSELWLTAQKREKEQELLFVGNQFRQALARYSANGGNGPLRLEDLLKDSRVPGVRRHLRRIYRDPITGGTEWGLLRSAGADGVITGVYSLSAEAPLKQAEFSVADREFEGKKKYSEWVFAAKPLQGAQAATTPAGSATAAAAGAGAAAADGAGTAAPGGGGTAAAAGSAATAAGASPATSAAPGVATPAGSAATSTANAGATQNDPTLNRPQARVRR